MTVWNFLDCNFGHSTVIVGAYSTPLVNRLTIRRRVSYFQKDRDICVNQTSLEAFQLSEQALQGTALSDGGL